MEENGKKTIEEEEHDTPLTLELADPYKYDGVDITVLNMEGLVDLTAGDLCAIDREMLKRGYSGTRMDATRQYAMLVAAKVNRKPMDFCDRMGARDSMRLRDFVATFFYARG